MKISSSKNLIKAVLPIAIIGTGITASNVQNKVEEKKEIRINLEEPPKSTTDPFAPSLLALGAIGAAGIKPKKRPVNLPEINNEGCTELHKICKNGNLNIFKQFLKTHPNINLSQRTDSDETYMYLALDNKHKDIENLLAGMENYDPTVSDEDGRNDLHYLCENGHTETVKKIFETHPNINLSQMTNNGRTYMYLAMDNKHSDIENLLAGMENYDPTVPDEDGWNDLHCLCNRGHTETVKKILKTHPNINLSQRTDSDETYMYLAMDNEHKDIENLLAGMENYDPTVPDEDGWNDLHYLCSRGHTEIVKKILKTHPNINLNQKTNDGRTYMYLAMYNEHKDIENLLAGMENYDPTVPDEDGWNDLHYLCRNGHTETVKKILEIHPNIDLNQMTNKGRTYMNLAMDNKHKDIENLLAGMENYDPTVPDKDGWNDLHYLCRNGHTETVKKILKTHPNIDLNQKTNNGRTYMYLAMDNKHKDIENLLAGIENYDPTVPDKDGWNDLHYLCKKGHTETVKKILEIHPNIDLNQKTNDNQTCADIAEKNNRHDLTTFIKSWISKQDLQDYMKNNTNRINLYNTHDLYKLLIDLKIENKLNKYNMTIPIDGNDTPLLMYIAHVNEKNSEEYDGIIKILKHIDDINYNYKDKFDLSFLEIVLLSENAKLFDIVKNKGLEYSPRLDLIYQNIQNKEFKEKVKNELKLTFTDLEKAIEVESTEALSKIINQIKSPLFAEENIQHLLELAVKKANSTIIMMMLNTYIKAKTEINKNEN